MELLYQTAPVVFIAFFLTACLPANPLALTPTTLGDRQLQSRFYSAKDEGQMLAAMVALLQDTGYTIDAAHKKLGLISASKIASAINAKDVAGKMFLGFLSSLTSSSHVASFEHKQYIRISIVSRPSKRDKSGFVVRTTFQRVIRNLDGSLSRAGVLNDEELYNDFYNKLSKALFIEAKRI